MDIPKPPKELKTEGKRFWRETLSEFVLEAPHDLERLFQACGCLDDIAESEAVIKQEGRYIKDRFEQVKEHPAGKCVRESKALFMRLVRELGLDLVANAPPRPPARY